MAKPESWKMVTVVWDFERQSTPQKLIETSPIASSSPVETTTQDSNTVKNWHLDFGSKTEENSPLKETKVTNDFSYKEEIDLSVTTRQGWRQSISNDIELRGAYELLRRPTKLWQVMGTVKLGGNGQRWSLIFWYLTGANSFAGDTDNSVYEEGANESSSW